MKIEVAVELSNVTKRFSKTVHFWKKSAPITAVDDVSIQVYRGEIVGLVGESGSGKTTLGRLIIGLIRPDSGKILIQSNNVNGATGGLRKEIRKSCRMIFQNLDAALNPGMNIFKILEEPLKLHTDLDGENIKARIYEIMREVNLDASFLKKYSSSLSGGEKRRVSIARALAVTPEIIIADEPLAALDAHLRFEMIGLFKRLAEKFSLTMIFISHDLSIIEHLCTKILFMHSGRLVEVIETDKLLNNGPLHPYSRLLLSSVLKIMPGSKMHDNYEEVSEEPVGIFGNTGCHFVKFCPLHRSKSNNGICSEKKPSLIKYTKENLVACHYMEQKNE